MNRNTTIFASSLVLSISLIASSALISNAVSTPTIKACAVKKTGDLRIITGSAKCKKTERLVTWGAKGPTGAKGSTGAPAIPNVTQVNNYWQGWINIYVVAGGWDTISVVQTTQLLAGNYLVLANVNIDPNGNQAFCSVTTTPEAVGGNGTIRYATNIPAELGSQNLSFSSNVGVEAGQEVHLRCAGLISGAQARDASMTLIPLS
jgi:hypothetical protein